ncbi:hypothetical protein MW887_011628 [Aspergillus wentii]|nr:hypothetical protein MW887_011628 [Aspergillus wentii]
MSTFSVDSEYTGQSGRIYKIKQVIQQEETPPRRIYLATSGDQKFILKYIIPFNFGDLQDINNRLRGDVEHVRLAQDSIPDKSMFVFDYFTGHLFRLVQKDLPLDMTKRILKDALCGIVELHDRDIVHTDIRADNIFIDWKNQRDGVTIDRVLIGDLEDAAHIPPECYMIGKQAGNWMWRSPEAHAQGPVNKPSDIFSFALVCIYAIQKRVLFAVGNEELEPGVDPLAIVIGRQISYFANKDSLDAFLTYLGDDNQNPWIRAFKIIRDGFSQENPRKPFLFWKGVDEEFRGLICAMTNFDPEKRITAREALAHKWFEGV